MNKFIFTILCFFKFSIFVNAQLVSNENELNTAIDNAIPGTVITLQDGIWNDLEINVLANGNINEPIILQGETVGGVTLTGDSKISIGGSYIYVNGFNITDGSPTENFVIEFRSQSNTDCHHCKIINIKIDDFNPPGMQNTKWVILHGTNNEVAHCSFLRKKSVGSCVLVQRSDDDPDYHLIHHNHFAQRDTIGSFSVNDQDAIRVGFSGTSLSDSFCEVYNNYFDDYRGEIEVISNKSCKNKYFNNTFRDHWGTLTLRHGNDCEVYNNFFLGNQGFKSGGVRIIGENHLVYNNYVENILAGGSNAAGAITVINGKPNSALNEYYQVKNCIIAFNTIVDVDDGIRLGTPLNSTLTLGPENVIVANNIIVDGDNAIELINGSSITFANNSRQGGGWNIGTDNGNEIVSQDLLAAENLDYRRISAASSAVDNAAYDIPEISIDIQGALRPIAAALRDRGAEELGVSGSNRPYTSSDIGINVGAGSGSLNFRGIQVYLEACFNSSSGFMNTFLWDQNLIPLEQPYDGSPWSYAGNESINNPSSINDIVDWLLIELRIGIPQTSGSSGTSLAAAQAALLKKDGTIVNTDGDLISWGNLPLNQNYYVVVRHRNHLDIISSSPRPLENGSIHFDFTSNIQQAFGLDQQKAMTNGKAAIFAGDFNSDGVIQVTDFDLWSINPAALNVYSSLDATLDGTIQVTDYDQWTKNKAKLGALEIRY